MTKYDDDALNNDHERATLRLEHFAKQSFYIIGDAIGNWIRESKMTPEEFWCNAYMTGVNECRRRQEVYDASANLGAIHPDNYIINE